MDLTTHSKFLFLFLLSILLVCSSGSLVSPVNKQHNREDVRTLRSSRRELFNTVQHDFMNPPITTNPTTPVTNPVTTPVTNPATTPTPATVTGPPYSSTPAIVTVPSANPVTVTPTPVTLPPVNPVTNPANPGVPVTNPVTTPSTTIPGPGQPVTTYPTPTGSGVPVVAPPVVTNAPAVPGQSWCVARGGVQESALQAALDYACGIGGADCSAIQQGASCYNPSSLQNHASYAFNSYYQRNPVPTSCDFGGTAMITNVNPSSGSCIFTTWSPSSASPTTASPGTTTPIPTPTTASSSGAATTGSSTPPTVLNASNPALGGGVTGYGDSPPIANISSVSSWQPSIGCIIVVTSFITGRIVLDS